MPKIKDSELAEFARRLYQIQPVNSRTLGELIDRTQSLTHKKLVGPKTEENPERNGSAMIDREAKIIIGAFADYTAAILKVIQQYENSKRNSKSRKRKASVLR